MAYDSLTTGNDVYYSHLVPSGSETGNAIYALAGNDYVQGNGYDDLIDGNAGNDTLLGMGGDDILLGGAGADNLQGGSGDDLLVGDNGASGGTGDILYGGAGNDRMFGNVGNDTYNYRKSDGGFDTIADDWSASGVSGFGGGTDSLVFQDVLLTDLLFYQFGDDLIVTDVYDVADGYIDTGVEIMDFFLGGNNVIENVYGSNGSFYDISGWA